MRIFSTNSTAKGPRLPMYKNPVPRDTQKLVGNEDNIIADKYMTIPDAQLSWVDMFLIKSCGNAWDNSTDIYTLGLLRPLSEDSALMH